MYMPDPFRMKERDAIYGVVEAYPFGLLTVVKEGRIDAAHIPFLLDREARRLRCHVAAENPIHGGIEDAPVMAVFSGPHCYVSPRLCEGATFVPTWNYIAVHVRGMARTFRGEELARLVEELTRTHETNDQWNPQKLPAAVYERMLKNIIGIEISIDEIEGKSKLSQNRTIEERDALAAGLRNSEDPNSQSVAYLMAGLD